MSSITPVSPIPTKLPTFPAQHSNQTSELPPFHDLLQERHDCQSPEPSPRKATSNSSFKPRGSAWTEYSPSQNRRASPLEPIREGKNERSQEMSSSEEKALFSGSRSNSPVEIPDFETPISPSGRSSSMGLLWASSSSIAATTEGNPTPSSDFKPISNDSPNPSECPYPGSPISGPLSPSATPTTIALGRLLAKRNSSSSGRSPKITVHQITPPPGGVHNLTDACNHIRSEMDKFRKK